MSETRNTPRGLSLHFSSRNGRWLIKWWQRERQIDGSVSSRKRCRYAFSVKERDQLVAEIEQDLREYGYWRRFRDPMLSHEDHGDLSIIRWHECKKMKSGVIGQQGRRRLVPLCERDEAIAEIEKDLKEHGFWCGSKYLRQKKSKSGAPEAGRGPSQPEALPALDLHDGRIRPVDSEHTGIGHLVVGESVKQLILKFRSAHIIYSGSGIKSVVVYDILTAPLTIRIKNRLSVKADLAIHAISVSLDEAEAVRLTVMERLQSLSEDSAVANDIARKIRSMAISCVKVNACLAVDHWRIHESCAVQELDGVVERVAIRFSTADLQLRKTFDGLTSRAAIRELRKYGLLKRCTVATGSWFRIVDPDARPVFEGDSPRPVKSDTLVVPDVPAVPANLMIRLESLRKQGLKALGVDSLSYDEMLDWLAYSAKLDPSVDD